MTIEIWNYDVMLWQGEAENISAARETMWRDHPLYRTMTTQARIVDPPSPDFLTVLPGDTTCMTAPDRAPTLATEGDRTMSYKTTRWHCGMCEHNWCSRADPPRKCPACKSDEIETLAQAMTHNEIAREDALRMYPGSTIDQILLGLGTWQHSRATPKWPDTVKRP